MDRWRRTGNRWLVVLVKEPRAGQVKTRLGAGLGAVRAAMLYRHMIARAMRQLSHGSRWALAAAVTPDRKPGMWSSVRRAALVIGQGEGGLGARMRRAFVEMPPGPLVIIGTDIPEITAGDIDQAFRALNRSDVVIGPAGDGGYWLIGLAPGARHLDLFREVRWSSHHALADTLANLPNNRRVTQIRVLTDLDRRQDFINWTRKGGRISR